MGHKRYGTVCKSLANQLPFILICMEITFQQGLHFNESHSCCKHYGQEYQNVQKLLYIMYLPYLVLRPTYSPLKDKSRLLNHVINLRHWDKLKANVSQEIRVLCHVLRQFSIVLL